MNLKGRAKKVIDWMNITLPMEVNFHQRCINTLLVNFQHIRRGTVEDVLVLLKEERTKSLSTMNGTMTLFIDTVIRKVKQL
jgi:hypothetical protein